MKNLYKKLKDNWYFILLYSLLGIIIFYTIFDPKEANRVKAYSAYEATLNKAYSAYEATLNDSCVLVEKRVYTKSLPIYEAWTCNGAVLSWGNK